MPDVLIATKRALLPAVLLSLVLLSCAREQKLPPAPPPAKPVTPVYPKSVLSGCYRAEWKPAHPFPLYTFAKMKLPATFELTDIPVEPGVAQFVIKSRGENDFQFSEWEFASENKARLSWGTGFVGYTIDLSLPAREGVFEGVASTYSDVPETPETATVKLHPIPCQDLIAGER